MIPARQILWLRVSNTSYLQDSSNVASSTALSSQTSSRLNRRTSLQNPSGRLLSLKIETLNVCYAYVICGKAMLANRQSFTQCHAWQRTSKFQLLPPEPLMEAERWPSLWTVTSCTFTLDFTDNDKFILILFLIQTWMIYINQRRKKKESFRGTWHCKYRNGMCRFTHKTFARGYTKLGILHISVDRHEIRYEPS